MFIDSNFSTYEKAQVAYLKEAIEGHLAAQSLLSVRALELELVLDPGVHRREFTLIKTAMNALQLHNLALCDALERFVPREQRS